MNTGLVSISLIKVYSVKQKSQPQCVSLSYKRQSTKEKFNFYENSFSKGFSNRLLPFPSVVLESWLDFTGELEPPDPLARLPQLKRRIKQLLIDMGKVQQIATLCSV